MVRAKSYSACGLGSPGVLCSWRRPTKDPLPEAVAVNTVVVTEDDQGMRTLRFGTKPLRQSVVKVGDQII